jgi:hypothetical protein
MITIKIKTARVSKFLTSIFLCSAILLSCKKEHFAISKYLERQPYIQMLGANQATIKWKTYKESESVVRFGTHPDSLLSIKKNTKASKDHQITLTELIPSTKYYYSIGTTTETYQGDSNNYFISSPASGVHKKTSIWIIGDAGSGTSNQNKVRDSYFEYSNNMPPDIWLWLGDNAYERGTEEEYQENVFTNHFEGIMKNTNAWPTIGNHDFANQGYQTEITRTHMFPYYNIFQLPENGELGGVPSGTEKYYSFNYSNVHFICLDSYASYNAESSPMNQWLKKDLEATAQKWTIVYFHHPPYTKGSHDSDTEVESIGMRKNILPLLEEHGVDLVFSGHSHVYERSFLLKGHFGNESTITEAMILDKGIGKQPNPYIKKNPSQAGTIYVVVGTSGKAGGQHPGWPHNAMAYSNNNQYGSMALEVDNNTLSAKYISKKGKILDEFSIQK